MTKVPFVDLLSQYKSIQTEIDTGIREVITESAYIGGKHVNAFESTFASKMGLNHCISVANGTDSLYIIQKMLGIGPGDEVITSAYSWISSSETISQTGATPVFIDIDDYFTIDASKIEEKITSKTRAIVVVHIHGQSCDMEKIKTIADRHGIFLIEDCAQSHFSEFQGQKLGTFGIASSFSFYPGKNLGAYGDAGAIVCNDKTLAEKFRMYARHGALIKHEHLIEGINSRLDGLQAAILNVKLKYIDQWTEQRIRAAGWYTDHLGSCPGIELPRVRPETRHTFHLYVIKCNRRKELMEFLSERGVDTAIHYPTALVNLPAYTYLNLDKSQYPNASSQEETLLSLPIYPEISEEQVAHVCNSLNEFYSQA